MSTNYNELNKKELFTLAQERGLLGADANYKKQTVNGLVELMEKADVKEAAECELPKNEEETKEAKKSLYAVNAMRDAIIAARKTGNRHAITNAEAIMSGTTNERWQQWKLWCDDLYEKLVAYVNVAYDRTASEDDVEKAYNDIYPVWRTLLKVGEENVFHKNMFVRPADVRSLIVSAEKWVVVAGEKNKGTVGGEVFRREIETLIGFKISGNMVLSDADRDILEKFYSAVNSIKTAQERLNGKVDNKGQAVEGLIKQIHKLENSIAYTRSMLDKYINIEPADEKNKVINDAVAGQEAKLSELKTAKENAEKSLKNAEETYNKYLEQAKAIEEKMATEYEF